MVGVVRRTGRGGLGAEAAFAGGGDVRGRAIEVRGLVRLFGVLGSVRVSSFRRRRGHGEGGSRHDLSGGSVDRFVRLLIRRPLHDHLSGVGDSCVL